jgi:hypothetical protein
MEPHVSGLFEALENSGLGIAIRQSVWAYPAANVTHIVALVVFAGAVTVMDARLLGAFAATPPRKIVGPAQSVVVAAFLLQASSGFLLFTAEASHVSANPVFQVKMGLVVLGLLNALAVQRTLSRALTDTQAFTPLPLRLRVSAAASLAIWITVAAAGRLIAYF